MNNLQSHIIANNKIRVRFNHASIGDTLGITALAESYYNLTGNKLEVVTHLTDIFLNNPHVDVYDMSDKSKNDIVLNPCASYDCNIVKNFANQLDIKNYTKKPKLYLSESENDYAVKKLSNWFDKKYKIIVCLSAAVDSRSIRYNIVSPMIIKLKREIDCAVFLIGKANVPLEDTYGIFDEQFYDISIRECFSIISKCDLYFGADTGLSHAAAALSVPQVVIYRNCGCENNAYIDTFFRKSNINCSGNCLKPHCKICGMENRCIDNVSLDEYFDLIINILATI